MLLNESKSNRNEISMIKQELFLSFKNMQRMITI